MLKRILKIVGIVTLCFALGIGALVGGLAIAGQFKENNVPLSGIAFENSSYYIDKTTNIKILSTPEDSTNVTYSLSIISGQNVINIPGSATANTAFSVSPKQIENINVGGYAKIRATANDNHFCECSIYVDVPVSNVSVVTQSENEIIVGNKINVNLSYLPLKSEQPYSSANLKTVTYISTNPSVATVNAETGEVTTLTTGSFQIKAVCFKSLNAENEYNRLKQEGAFEESGFQEENGLNEEEYLADITVTNLSNTFTVRKSRVASLEIVQPDLASIEEIYLYDTVTLTPEDIGLKIKPETNSNLTWEDNTGLAKDIDVVAINDTSTDISSKLSVEKIFDGTVFAGWELNALKYEERSLNNTRLKFTFTNEDNSVVTAVFPISIIKNDIKDGEDSFILRSGSSEEANYYNKEIKYYEFFKQDADGNFVLDEDEKPILDSKSIYENFQLEAIMQVKDDTKPKNLAIRYFIKDVTDTGIINTISETGTIDNKFYQAGEIVGNNFTRGYVEILSGGEVQIIAYAVEIDENGEPILTGEGDNQHYTIAKTANNGIVLNLSVSEMLTNVNVQIEDENETNAPIIITYTDNNLVEKTAYRELQNNINLIVSTYNSSEVLKQWFEANYLQFNSTTENYAVASFESQINTDNDIKSTLSIFKLQLAFNNDNKQQQVVTGNIRLNLTTSGSAVYGTNSTIQDDKSNYYVKGLNFQNGNLNFDIITARVTDFTLESNTKDVSSDNYVVSFATDKWVNLQSELISLTAIKTPSYACDDGFVLSSSNSSILTINNSAIEHIVTTGDTPEDYYDFSKCLVWTTNSPAFNDGDTVTITVRATDDTFHSDSSNPAKGLFKTLTFTLMHAPSV